MNEIELVEEIKINDYSDIFFSIFTKIIFMRIFLILVVFFIICQDVWAQKIQQLTDDFSLTPATYIKKSDQLANHENKTLKDYILKNCTRIQEAGTDIQLDIATPSLGGFHARFLQTYLNIPIYQGSVKINLTKTDRVLNILAHIYQFTHAQVHFSKPFQPIYDELQNQWGGNPNFVLRMDSIFYPIGNEIFAAYRFRTEADSKGSQEFIYSASNAQLLHHQVTAMAHHEQADTNGKGLVFNPDPLTKNQVNYGGQYKDNSNATSSFLDNSRDTVVLQGLKFESGVFKLEGPFVKIENVEFPNDAPATSADGNFYFNRNQKGFEDVNAYYHIDLTQRYIQSLGFANLGNSAVRVDPHGNFNQDNSYFVAGSNSYISFGDGGVDDAEDADVCTHEYGHFLSDAGSPGTNTGYERQGLDEGIGDYIQASYSRSISIYDWDSTFTWDGHNEFWAGRSCGITTPYLLLPTNSFYNQGSLWCTAMMKPQNFLPRNICDKIFFQELFMNNNNMTLVDAAHLVLDADTMLYGGQYSGYYISAFCQTGILSGNICLSAARETFDNETWVVFPNPCINSLLIRNLPSEKATIKISDLSGKVLKEMEIVGKTELEINVSEFSPGLYIIDYQAGNIKEFRKFSKN